MCLAFGIMHVFDSVVYVDEFVFFSKIIGIDFREIVGDMWYLFPDLFGKSAGLDSLEF